ncbi:hypothetical protein D0B54_15935 [Solimonas sp. K1W22B-7]|uniref:hypothetical protein n=1 Tax=Solimonas sp. K1W22B-7 TaxID=2303331 RepID=UPI000E335C3F|nr:hypothetical protein [Solimonas sp. K1W22B-7]AXQ30069.1 hypothetical protein D0B54_15935 [Solimonas sp. K1W22B-7]
MSNRSYLINSSFETSSPDERFRSEEEPGRVWGEVAEGSNRLPIPRFLCFRQSDLRPATWNGDMQRQLPCTTLEQAVRNFEQARPVYEAIAGDAGLARPYWDLVLALLRRLPLPYLSMDPVEWLILGDVEAGAARLVQALAGDLSAVPHIKAMSEYEEGARPYPLDVLYSVPSGKSDRARIWNASVLDGGFQPNLQYATWQLGPGAAEPTLPPPLPDSLFGEIYDINKLIKDWLSAAAPDAAGADLGLYLDQGQEHLRVTLYARGEADARQLVSDPTLKQRLGELAHNRLQPWCRKHGFGWQGFRCEVPDWARR